MNTNTLGLPYPQRRQIRLQSYDYSWQGAYFITVCTWDKQSLFGHILNGSMKLNFCGEVVKCCWKDIPLHYPEVKNEVFIVMPNHIHGIVFIQGLRRAGSKPAPTNKHPLSEIVWGFKTYSSRKINEYRQSQGTPVWHLFNPAKWESDCENPNIKFKTQPLAFEFLKTESDSQSKL